MYYLCRRPTRRSNHREIEIANRDIIRSTQTTAFSKEIHALKNRENISDKSRLIPLKPFVDSQEIIQVGGRLIYSKLPAERKNHILLPSNHHVTHLIIRDEHERLTHAGTQATLYSVRELFRPLDGRNITRIIIHKCVRWFRAKPRGVDYLMGDLSQERVTYSRPFLNGGVEYCSPLFIKEKRFRNRNKIKVYVAVFVCMGTKAVHLELVSDLTTAAFIACLKKLFSGRGISKTIYSDNATNFVGASREFVELYNSVKSNERDEVMQNFLTQQMITWHFIPPHSLHFGGL